MILIDHKSKLEAKNNDLLLSFGTQLDHNLKDLFFIIQKSQIVELRIKNVTDTYTSGMTSLKHLVDTLKSKGSSDLAHIKSRISDQIMAVENIFNEAVMEAKNATCDIQNSIAEQKYMLALSAQQYEEGLHRNLVSAHEISRATIDSFENLRKQATKIMAAVEEHHKTRSHHLKAFKKNFKEDTDREEQLAIKNISAILRNLTARQTSIVSMSSQLIDDMSSQDNKTLLQDVSNMLQISDNGTTEVNEYMEKTKTRFTEDTFISSESRALIDDCLEECTNKVEKSLKHWDTTNYAIRSINESNMVETESIIREMVHVNDTRSEEIDAVRMSTDAKFQSDASDLKSSVIDSLMLDQEMKKEFDSMSKVCVDQLTCLEDKHVDKTKNVLNQVERFKEDYQVDCDSRPIKHEIDLPSLTSIDAMRTPAFADVIAATNIACENGQKCVENGSEMKNRQQRFSSGSPNRSPFADVN